MTQTAEISAADWTAQAGLSADQLPARLRAHFRDLAQLDDEAIRATWERFLPAEAELADEALRRMTQARLRAFIGMETDQVQKLVSDLLTTLDELERRAGGETESTIEKPEAPAAARPWWNSTKWKFW